MATFLACFNIGKAKDEFGNEIEFDDSFNEFGVVMCVQIPLFPSEGAKLGLTDTRSRSSAVSPLDLNRFGKSSRAQDINFEISVYNCICTMSSTGKVDKFLYFHSTKLWLK
jgi:hypothetical protein